MGREDSLPRMEFIMRDRLFKVKLKDLGRLLMITKVILMKVIGNKTCLMEEESKSATDLHNMKVSIGTEKNKGEEFTKSLGNINMMDSFWVANSMVKER